MAFDLSSPCTESLDRLAGVMCLYFCFMYKARGGKLKGKRGRACGLELGYGCSFDRSDESARGCYLWNMKIDFGYTERGERVEREKGDCRLYCIKENHYAVGNLIIFRFITCIKFCIITWRIRKLWKLKK